MRKSPSPFRVVVVGGTHGNERAGPVLARYFDRRGERNRRAFPNLELRGIVANLEAVQKNVRYVDEDLNRCFSREKLLAARGALTSEVRRARDLNAELGPKGGGEENKTDFIFDLHNSTSNTGVLLCFHEEDHLAREVAAFLHHRDRSVRAALWLPGDQPYLPTIARSGMTVEVGPVAHGTIKFEAMDKVRHLLEDALGYLNFRLDPAAAGGARKINVKLPLGERVGEIDFPRDASDPSLAVGFLHPSIQNLRELQDGSHVSPGQPVFVDVEGAPIRRLNGDDFPTLKPYLDRGELLYPIFVNEAAYYEKKTAFFVNRRRDVEVRILEGSPSFSSSARL